MELRVLNFFNGCQRRKYYESSTTASCNAADTFPSAHAVGRGIVSAAFSHRKT